MKIHFCPDGCLWERQDLLEIQAALGMRAVVEDDKTKKHLLRLKKDVERMVKAIDKKAKEDSAAEEIGK